MAPRGAYQVLVDTYVTDDAGTGIVQQAPYFGEVCRSGYYLYRKGFRNFHSATRHDYCLHLYPFIGLSSVHTELLAIALAMQKWVEIFAKEWVPFLAMPATANSIANAQCERTLKWMTD